MIANFDAALEHSHLKRISGSEPECRPKPPLGPEFINTIALVINQQKDPMILSSQSCSFMVCRLVIILQLIMLWNCHLSSSKTKKDDLNIIYLYVVPSIYI